MHVFNSFCLKGKKSFFQAHENGLCLHVRNHAPTTRSVPTQSDTLIGFQTAKPTNAMADSAAIAQQQHSNRAVQPASFGQIVEVFVFSV
mmetsp:Transcript_11966/g.22981  ORF Transcript_11966/g.22981 Transcript_11966/m.22981 type:complete len:89 (+) Transcript_11966:39-305(+)